MKKAREQPDMLFPYQLERVIDSIDEGIHRQSVVANELISTPTGLAGLSADKIENLRLWFSGRERGLKEAREIVLYRLSTYRKKEKKWPKK
jgi:hypothetical protein